MNKSDTKDKKDSKGSKGSKDPTTFIIGVVYNEEDSNKIEALSLYDRTAKKGYLQSLKTVAERVQNGENILGITVREEIKFSPSLQDFKATYYPVLDTANFNYKKLNILNGAGAIVLPGKDVIVGTLTEDEEIYCVVVNSNYELRKVKKKDAIRQQLVGTFRDTILRVCREPMEI